MNDLIVRAKKYAQGAGRIQEGQYARARRDERFARWIGWMSAALSGIVGTSISIFAQWVQKNHIVLGLLSIIAATFSTVQRTAKLAERAEAHRLAGTEYGRLRRQLDMLRVRLEGGDITREAALLQLDHFGEKLSDAAREARVLPDGIYARAVREFDKRHPEYDTRLPTH